MELKDIRNIYFVGAGGIGMAALERYFLSLGKKVAGYDRTPSALTPDLARKAMASYPGVERRFQFHLRPAEGDPRAIIDDYAHHPDELRSSIRSVRALFPGRRLTVAFQPHLYSRTRDFAAQFAEALSGADSVILVDLYPAREEPIPGISEKTIFDKVKCADKEMISKQDFVNRLKNRNFDVLLTAGAGDLNILTARLADEIAGERRK